MKFPLRGKLALITGASGGLGKAMAEACAKRGARLILCGRRKAELKELSATLGAQALCFDLEKPQETARQLKAFLKGASLPDLLINNAGRHMFSSVEKLPLEDFRSLLELNLFAPLHVIQAFLPGMKRRGSGMIVQIGSALGYRSLEGVGAYSASKAALSRVSESLRMELKGSGIQVLEVAPGVVLTDLRNNAWYRGAAPLPSAKLPFAQEPKIVAERIADAIEAAKREFFCAAWPVRFGMRYLNAVAPGLMDRFLEGKN